MGDTFNGKDHKRVGWTQSVDQAATNVLNVNDDPNSRPVIVKRAAITDPSVNSSITVAPMPPRKRSTLGGIINAGTSPINIAPTGFNQQPEEELAERLRRGSVASNAGSPNRMRRVCRAPVQRKEDPTNVEVSVVHPEA